MPFRVVAFVLTLLTACAQVMSAAACPLGTVFSAKSDGTNGICAFVGQGARAAVNCAVAQGSCPAKTSREHSTNDPGRDYCCSTQPLPPSGHPIGPFEACAWFGTAPICRGRCPAGWRDVKGDRTGDGATCATGQKVYCCENAFPKR